MARQLCQTLTKLSPKWSPLSLSRPTLFHSSSKGGGGGGGGDLIELDLDPTSSTTTTEGIAGLKRLEDAIHTIFVRRLAPDWLPFRPGSSYWVPPRQPVADNIVELVGKLTNPLTPEESLSLTSARGWPSSSFFIHHGPLPLVEVQVLAQKSENASLSEDEE